MTETTWQACPAPDSNYEWDIVDSAGVTVAEVMAYANWEPLPVEEFARLMAAAPALLAALEGLQKEHGHSAGCLAGNAVSLPCIPECAAARAAIAAARGLEDT